MIVVTGANGQLGRLVIEELLLRTAAENIVATVRNPETAGELAALGIQLRQADYDQPATLTKAFAGAEKVLLISSSAVGQRVPQHQAVIHAAEEAGVQLLAYTSILHCDRSPLQLAEEHQQTEALLNASSVATVILRNGWYTENYTMSIPVMLEMKQLFGCAAEGRFSTASRHDYATAAATVLTTDNQAGKVYELAGDHSFSLAEFAALLSRQSGTQVSFQNLSETDFTRGLVQAGLPEGFAALLANAESGAAEGWLFDDSKQLQALIGRPTTPAEDTVQAALS
ncbi:SDR family oxidoreductase [Aliamphritea hakodatensis]|uniref:SDR family oxidoreductase n=1 Tax=Aliamphritea hakodatensis TaxID=2895352 RepID=UPI0022FD3845|nr:SDR family oxidoreductase [Aliamphritea hakodatensis]